MRWPPVGRTRGTGSLIGFSTAPMCYHSPSSERSYRCCCGRGHVGDAGTSSKRHSKSTSAALAPDRHQRAALTWASGICRDVALTLLSSDDRSLAVGDARLSGDGGGPRSGAVRGASVNVPDTVGGSAAKPPSCQSKATVPNLAARTGVLSHNIVDLECARVDVAQNQRNRPKQISLGIHY
jgi:hypothetical protein